jgi:hypothetical protein
MAFSPFLVQALLMDLFDLISYCACAVRSGVCLIELPRQLTFVRDDHQVTGSRFKHVVVLVTKVVPVNEFQLRKRVN